MKHQPNKIASENTAEDDQSVTRHVQDHALRKHPLYLRVAWLLLLLVGAFFLFASLSDLISDARSGLPSDHLEAFQKLAGISWTGAKLSSPQITQYITTLEIAYAVHEMVFGLLFLIIIAIPFRRRARWAWWACWIPMLANLTYTFTLAHYSTTTLTYSLIADILLPIALFLHIPAFFGEGGRTY